MNSTKIKNSPEGAMQNRNAILEELAERLEFVGNRIDRLEASDDVDELTLIRWTRAQAYLAGQFRKLKNDKDIDRMQADLELLKEVTNLEEHK